MLSHGRSVIWKNISSVANISKLENLICRMKMLHFVWHIPVLFFRCYTAILTSHKKH